MEIKLSGKAETTHEARARLTKRRDQHASCGALKPMLELGTQKW